MAHEKVVVRFPPSPTGYLHIGGARTALFNWLFARQKGGKFILRIEDTDRQRSTDEATKAILESMEWLGLDWDEGPYFQSRRYDLYEDFIERLISKGQAYHCHCSPDELEQKRKEAMAKGLKPKYDGKCRDLGLGPAPGSVVRLKTPLVGITRFNDLVKGAIRFDNEELDDLVLKRSDGSPTYHLAVVADDINLGITHIIRGDDHVNNTPRQILIYKAIGESLPQYAHVPMILGTDRARLSKRHGAMSVLAYRDEGYLPHALINSLVRLGWSYGDQERFTIEELIDKFSLKNVGKSAGIFNADKMLDLNAGYIRETSNDILAELVTPFLKKSGFQVATFVNGTEYLEFIKNTIPDVTILDLMLPDIDGMDMCKVLRRDSKYDNMSIIILSGRIDESDTILGLELGADDYVKKPFSPKELAVRVKTVLRRKAPQNAQPENKINIDNKIVIDIDRYEVHVDGELVALTPTEYRILKMLAEKNGNVLKREEILYNLWGNEKIVVDHTVDVHIKHLREKLEPYADLVKNVRGVGYKLGN